MALKKPRHGTQSDDSGISLFLVGGVNGLNWDGSAQVHTAQPDHNSKVQRLLSAG